MSLGGLSASRGEKCLTQQRSSRNLLRRDRCVSNYSSRFEPLLTGICTGLCAGHAFHPLHQTEHQATIMQSTCPLQRPNQYVHYRDTARTGRVISTPSCHRKLIQSHTNQVVSKCDKLPPQRSSSLGQDVASTVTAQDTIRTHSLLTLLYENFRRASGR